MGERSRGATHNNKLASIALEITPPLHALVPRGEDPPPCVRRNPGCHNRAMPTVRVHVTLKPSLLDSAGRTVAASLTKLGYGEVTDARIGKEIVLQVEQVDDARIKEMCEKLLSNPVIEDYRSEVVG